MPYLSPLRGRISSSLAPWSPVAWLLSLSLAGCEVEATLPPCDATALAASTEVVFLDAPSDTRDDGIPMYAGQALFHLSCGGTAFCHATQATGMERVSTPAGIDFDLGPACIDAACDPAGLAFRRFAHRHRRVTGEADDLYGWFHQHLMPPGPVGKRVSERVGRAVHLNADGRLANGTPIPTYDTLEGRLLLSQWLACGAPVVQTTLPADATHLPGDACARASTDVGDCVHRMVIDPAEQTPSPTTNFDALYDHLFSPLCGQSCHGAGEPSAGEPDLSTSRRAYEAIRYGERLVDVANPDASEILVMLDRGGAETPRMPPDNLLTHDMPAYLIGAVRQWIVDGANPPTHDYR